MTRLAAVSLVAVVALALVAPSLSAAAPPSAWARAADALCAKADADSRKLPVPRTAKQRIATIEKSIVIGNRLADALARLPRPAADAAEIAKLVAIYRQAVALLRNVVTALRANDTARVDKELARASVIGRSFSLSAEKLSALGCAQ